MDKHIDTNDLLRTEDVYHAVLVQEFRDEPLTFIPEVWEAVSKSTTQSWAHPRRETASARRGIPYFWRRVGGSSLVSSEDLNDLIMPAISEYKKRNIVRNIVRNTVRNISRTLGVGCK
ncbi:MAG TPA: hypothetical protein VKP88_00240 [Candidatus Paceibacterota bacterium]|nr:hypothetical protein [Candidatus Paceibacterota bacterium]